MDSKENVININNSTEYKLINKSSKTLLHFDIYNKEGELVADVFEKFSIITPIYLLRDENRNVIASFQKDFDITGAFINVICNKGDCYIKNTFDKNISEIYKNGFVEAYVKKINDNEQSNYILTLNNDNNAVFFIGLLVIYIKTFESDNDIPLETLL